MPKIPGATSTPTAGQQLREPSAAQFARDQRRHRDLAGPGQRRQQPDRRQRLADVTRTNQAISAINGGWST